MRITAWILFICWLGLGSLRTEVPATYVVHKGDSLYSIGKKFGITAKAIQLANGIDRPTQIKVGQKLIIPLSSAGTLNPSVPGSTATNSSLAPASTVHARLESALNALPIRPIPQPAPPQTDPLPTEPPSRPAPALANQHYVFLDPVKEIIDAPTVTPGRWKYIVLHHSGTPRGNARIYDADHRRRGMENGLAYHFVIGNGIDSGDGQIEVGNRWLKQLKGGHVVSEAVNQIAIGICFVGNFNEERPSRKQLAAALELVTYLRQICGPKAPSVWTHTEIHPHHTECPGRLFPTAAIHRLFPDE